MFQLPDKVLRRFRDLPADSLTELDAETVFHLLRDDVPLATLGLIAAAADDGATFSLGSDGRLRPLRREEPVLRLAA